MANNHQHQHQLRSNQHSPEGRLRSMGVLSPKHSEGEPWTGRRKVTKHNSMMYSVGRRDTKSKKDFNDRRRKSVPAVVLMQREAAGGGGTLSRTSSKWSLRKDSLVDSQWKGIRWKPFVADGERTSGEDAGEQQQLQSSLHPEVVYVNEGFVASTPEENFNQTDAHQPSAAANNRQILSPQNSPVANGTTANKMQK